MSIKIVKAVVEAGRCNEEGLSFSESYLLTATRRAYVAAQKEADKVGGLSTGPARILITVEQEILV